jgi:hypothetical protein
MYTKRSLNTQTEQILSKITESIHNHAETHIFLLNTQSNTVHSLSTYIVVLHI